MRMPRKNRRSMKYALYQGQRETYLKDTDGETVYEEVDGELVPVPDGMERVFSEPVPFFGTLSFSGGDSEATEYGISVDEYDAKLVALARELPITETSLLFLDSEPEYRDGVLIPESADFRVIRVTPSLNQTVYLLQQVSHDEGI